MGLELLLKAANEITVALAANNDPNERKTLATAALGLFEAVPQPYETIIGDQNSTAVYHNRGFVKDELGRFEEAITDYNQAIELDPHFSHSYSWRGTIHEQQGNREQAIADYQTALAQLKDIPVEKLLKNNVKHLIRATDGLTRLGQDHSEDLNRYRALAAEKGYQF